jgi:hypothetical protein
MIFENISKASITIHVIIGLSFLVLAIFETVKTQKEAKTFSRFIPLSFFITFLLALISLFYYLGNFNLKFFISVLKAYKNIFALIAMTLPLLILSLTYFISNFVNTLWERANLFFIFFYAIILIFFHRAVIPTYKTDAILTHIFIAFPLFIYAIIKTVDLIKPSINLKKICAIALFIVSFELITYSEDPNIFNREIEYNKTVLYIQKEIKNENNNKKRDINRPEIKNKK